ncbi:MAG: ABC transporter substrate-binding protein [Deltaproteobacteria bacterium]|nr:ABC transporter substrate-binding protein [Deltaproteobacteria bacterium]
MASKRLTATRLAAPIAAALLALLLPLRAALADAGGSWPRSVTDALGRTCTVPRPPQRIVPLFSGNTELVAGLGLAGLIVGIDARTWYPPEIAGLPKIGSRLGVSVEQVAARKPDLVVITPSTEVPQALTAALSRMGIPSVVLASRSVAEIESNFRTVAYLAGVEERGELVIAGMERRLADVRRRRAGKPKPRVVLVTSKLPSGLFGVVRKGGYTGEIVELAGGILALDEGVSGPRLPQISPEALIALDPDVIVEVRRRDQGPEIAEYLARPSFSRLKAQREGQIHVLASSGFLIPAARVVDGVEALCRIFDERDATVAGDSMEARDAKGAGVHAEARDAKGAGDPTEAGDSVGAGSSGQ